MIGCRIQVVLSRQVDKPSACFLMRSDVADEVYGPRERSAAARLAAITDNVAEAEVILATWGCPGMDAGFLDKAPGLRLVLYAAGSVRAFVTDAPRGRGIRGSGCDGLNRAPVA